MGRTKLDIKKIENRARRQTTFTKRRQGLFKKADELSTKCGADVAVISFSMAGNVYAFGNPNVDHVLSKYDSEAAAEEESDVDAGDGERLKDLEGEYKETAARMEVEKRVGEIMEAAAGVETGGGRKAMWDEAIEDLGLMELQQLDSTIEEMKKKVAGYMNMIRQN